MISTNKSNKKIILKVIGIVISIPIAIIFAGLAFLMISGCLGGALTGGFLLLKDVMDYATWREHTVPLSEEVVDDLCSIFELAPDDERCDHSGDDVYGPDFFTELHKNINPEMTGWSTYDEINEKLGPYQYEREPVVEPADGNDYYVIHYDFAGDRVFSFIIFYNTDGSVRRLIAKVLD